MTQPIVAAPGPFLKWAGGKGQLLAQLEAYLPREFAAYHEPFVGSGALFFRLAGQRRIRRASLSDVNPELINCYRVIRDSVEQLIVGLEAHQAAHGREHYYAVRALDRSPERLSDPVERAARMIYLNRTCYNGLWRVNRQGHFNVPMGRYDKPRILDAPNLRAASLTLADVEIAVRPFESILERAQPGDLVYFDPPYVPMTSTANFTSYTADAFGETDQQRLAEVFRALAARGCKLILSNSDTPLVRDLYAGFRIETVYASRMINSQVRGRGRVAEVLALAG